MHHTVSGINFLLLFGNLLMMSAYHCHLISHTHTHAHTHTPVRYLLYHQCHHPSLLLSRRLKTIFSVNPSHHSSATFYSTDSSCFCSVSRARRFCLVLLCLLSFYRATACKATRGIAKAFLSVCPSVCLSVKRVHCDKTKETCAHIVIPRERSMNAL